METITWIGIIFCITQSGMFSGLNLALLGIGRLRLELEAASGNPAAIRVLDFRQDFNFTLTSILWGNVAVNTLLAILANSVLTGLVAFIFSTFVITFIGEIIPQAYFSRHALRMASLLAPVLRFYQFLLYPLAKPSAMMLDRWLGEEGIQYYKEEHVVDFIRRHIESTDSDVDQIEGIGALNFLVIDDLPVAQEGEPLNPQSIIKLEFMGDRPVFPDFGRDGDDTFLQRIHASGKKWVILTDKMENPRLVLDADGFIRSVLLSHENIKPTDYCHQPIIVHDGKTQLHDILRQFIVEPESGSDDVVDKDIVLVWSKSKRIITGADILGRLLRGIVRRSTDLDFNLRKDESD